MNWIFQLSKEIEKNGKRKKKKLKKEITEQTTEIGMKKKKSKLKMVSHVETTAEQKTNKNFFYPDWDKQRLTSMTQGCR